ncbi:MAG: type-F conjugative transfer system secretin TraK [Candidatus Dadabacteria bacterium]|nr:type-F conjugative transfer system secretin TraK [Candidatus Dadabacteria bacterium]MDE0291112.1 type-F conjugative transfer system secretin TraK [Candidatus Dadabacteria bacterium]MDE0477603.1 type-F conjugative transfer system secretin TraK [Candidatus Dadabacteria bacterium]MYB26767.1 hypothetical protein [Candidatus Dadabacteria bacterium]
MNTDLRLRVLTVFAAAFFTLNAAAAALTIDLGETREEEPISLGISRTDANRIELPETIINAFSSSGSIDVKIIGRSALVRTEDPAELIILTEKRRLTLLLSPEEGPSRTVIMRDEDETSSETAEEATGAAEPLPYERAITDLVVSLASEDPPAEEISGKEQRLSGSLFLAHRAEMASPPFFASLYVVRNSGSETTALTESMFLDGPGTVAVGMERSELAPGESGRVFVVTKKEPRR